MGSALDLTNAAARWAARWLRGAAQLLEQRWSSGARSYDGAAKGARNDGWVALGTSANAEVGASLVETRNRVRELVRNNAHARRAVNALVSNLVGGVGLTPVIDTGDEALDKEALLLWEDWGKRCSATTRLGIRGVQMLLARSWFADGEVLVRFRPRFTSDMPGLPPFQLQVLEGDYLDESLTMGSTVYSGANAGNRIIQGVELDPLDRRVAYHLWRSHPGDGYAFGDSLVSGERTRVPAEQVLHLFFEDRPGQVRGITFLHAIMQALWDLGGYQDAERVKQRASATLVAAVEGGEEPDTDDDESTPNGITTTKNAAGTKLVDGRGDPVETLRPGYVVYAPDGKKVNWNPTVPSTGFRDNVSVSLHEVAAGVGLSYEVLSGDLSQVNFSSAKLGLIEQHRYLRSFREHVFCPLALDPIWERFLAEAQALRLLPEAAGLARIRWSSPQLGTADRKADIEASALEIAEGLRSRRDVIASDGRDPDDVDAEIAKDNAARKALGIVTKSGPAVPSSGGSAADAGGGDTPNKP